MSGCLDPEQSGGVCEMVTGNAANGGQTESALCLKTLNDIVTTQCDATLFLPKCLCGAISTEDCTAGAATPIGAAYQDYAADFGSDINAIIGNFETPTFGAGQANLIAECVGYFGCQCLGD
jgi:hypothetical protein